MTDQDQINERNCCLVIKGGKLTGRTLAFAMRAFLAAGRRVAADNGACGRGTKVGKQTIKQLAGQGGKLDNIQVSHENVKEFESIARKYSVDYAVMKDLSEDLAQGGPAPKHLVFFKSRDTETMTAAFREFSARQLSRSKDKPPFAQTLQNMLQKVKTQPELAREKTREAQR